jgi:hypothetical protein
VCTARGMGWVEQSCSTLVLARKAFFSSLGKMIRSDARGDLAACVCWGYWGKYDNLLVLNSLLFKFKLGDGDG